MRFVFTLLFIFIWTMLPAQKHDAFSFFGYENDSNHPLFGGGTIDFNFEQPKIYKEKKKVDFGTYCGACSDSLGKLLFYTNGISVQNWTHNLMQWGDSINLSYFWYDYQKYGFPIGVISPSIPAPGLPNQYYLFSMGGRDQLSTEQIVLAPLWYNRVDMNQNSGFGRVEEKNVVLLDSAQNEMIVVKHGNGRDWWVLTPLLSQPVHYAYLVGSTGINAPLIQVYGPPFNAHENPSFASISPNGKIYIRHDSYGGLRIYDFDRCTGQLSNLQIIPYENGFFSIQVTFSPDSRFLFINSYEAMMVMDMQAPDPALTLDTLAIYDGFSSPTPPFDTYFWISQMHGNKLYSATANGTRALHIIHHPDLPGLAADVEQHGITLPVYNSGTMCRFPNYSLGKWEGSPCDTLGFAGQTDGFINVPYSKPESKNDTNYKTLSPLRGKGIPTVHPPTPIQWAFERSKQVKEEREKRFNKKE
ncbi:MAG: hypothetical protein KA138_02675 [Saprospiraceae bacterium]|jgi:hypothetical protein|nr:hypothetical protein [Saprospiraceae bacterium]